MLLPRLGHRSLPTGAKDDLDIGDLSDDIKYSRNSDWDAYTSYIDALRSKSEAFISGMNVSASAELQSTYTILDGLEGNITVRLFASDTIASRLAAEILRDNQRVLGNRVSVEFDHANDVISGLQVTDPLEFQQDGVPNLKAWLSGISNDLEEDQNLAVNITGGFAATVPCLTIFGQENSVPLYYNFENSTTLINLL